MANYCKVDLQKNTVKQADNTGTHFKLPVYNFFKLYYVPWAKEDLLGHLQEIVHEKTFCAKTAPFENES